jgi:hypothetical protein
VTDPAADTLSAELSENLARLLEVHGKIEPLRALTEEQLNWKPEPGRWSVGECVLHMVETNVGYSNNLEAKIRELRERGKLARGPFKYGWFSRWFVGMVEPPVKRRLPAPKTFAPVSRRASVDDVGALAASVDRIAGLNRAAAGLDLRPKIGSPVSKLVRLEVGMALRLLGGHTLRHLLQAEAVMREPGFPAAANPGEAP